MITTITNQKGGIGKTTTALSLGYGLAARGYKTLLVDMDAQANLTMAAGIKSELNIYDLMKRKNRAADTIRPITDKLDIIAGSNNMATLDLDINEVGKEYRLKEVLEPIQAAYDFIIIDTPPALNLTTINALTVADSVIIPGQADIFSLDAVKRLYNETISVIKRYTNPHLIIDGILITRYKGRNLLTREMLEAYNDLAQELHTRVYNVKIRDTVTLSESQTFSADIFSYSKNSNAAADYSAFTDEYLEGKTKQ